MLSHSIALPFVSFRGLIDPCDSQMSYNNTAFLNPSNEVTGVLKTKKYARYI